MNVQATLCFVMLWRLEHTISMLHELPSRVIVLLILWEVCKVQKGVRKLGFLSLLIIMVLPCKYKNACRIPCGH